MKELDVLVAIIEFMNKVPTPPTPPTPTPAFIITHECKDFNRWQELGWTEEKMVDAGYAKYN